MIHPETLTPCTYEQYLKSIFKLYPEMTKEEIEILMGKPIPLENSNKVLNPLTLEPMTMEELEKAKQEYLHDNKFISIVFMFADKYRLGDMYEVTESINIKAKKIKTNDSNRYGAWNSRPFEHGCMMLCGIPKKCIDELSEAARGFLTNFSVIQASESYYDSYDLVVFYENKDNDGTQYVRDFWFDIQ